MRNPLHALLLLVAAAALFLGGCSPFAAGSQAKASLADANAAFLRGEYTTALDTYAQVVESYPAAGDRALFEMGIIHGHPRNPQKDERKALDAFQRLIRDYPESRYRQDSEQMIFYLGNVAMKDRLIAEQQTQLAALRQELAARDAAIAGLRDDLAALRDSNAALEQKLFAHVLRNGTADRILIEKEARRLTLFAGGESLKSYRIALGGDPLGPKVRQGDGKTPEGVYFIEAKNPDSRFHLALRISYPNERDRQRARELGVAPGGDIMIHGLKNGWSQVGEAHAEADWTRGCIAVTDAEIAEIFKLVPIGATVEIRP